MKKDMMIVGAMAAMVTACMYLQSFNQYTNHGRMDPAAMLNHPVITMDFARHPIGIISKTENIREQTDIHIKAAKRKLYECEFMSFFNNHLLKKKTHSKA